MYGDPKTSKILQFKLPSINVDAHEFRCDPHIMCDHVILANMISHLAMAGLDQFDEDCVVMAFQGEIKRLAYNNPLWDDDDDTRRRRSLGWIGLQEDYGCGSNQLVFSDTRRLFFTLNRGVGILAYDLHCDLKKRSKMVFMFPWDEVARQLEQHYQGEDTALGIPR